MNPDNTFSPTDPMDILSTPLEKQFLKKIPSSSTQERSSNAGFESIGSYIASTQSSKEKSAPKAKSGKKTVWLTILLIVVLGVAGSLLYFQQNPTTFDNLTAKIKSTAVTISDKTIGLLKGSTTMNLTSETTQTETEAPYTSTITTPTNPAQPIITETATQPQTELDDSALTLGETPAPVAPTIPSSNISDSTVIQPIVAQPTDPLEIVAQEVATLQQSINLLSIQIKDLTAMRAREAQAQAELAAIASGEPLPDVQTETTSQTTETVTSTENVTQITAQIESITAEIQSLMQQAQALQTATE